jgi:hypothetical protein
MWRSYYVFGGVLMKARSISKTDIYLILILLAMTIAVVAKSYFHVDGGLTHDSTNYLKLAQNLLEGNGYYTTPCTILANKEREFFGIWPVGYPTMIFLVARILNIGVFWASKVLNIVFVLFGICILRKLFKENAYIYATTFLFAPYIVIYSYTWSEAPFLFGLIWFVYSIYYCTIKPSNLRILNAFISSLFLFSVRFIGAFSLGFLGMLSIYRFWRRDYAVAIKLLVLSTAGITIVSLYLYHNYLATGFFEGRDVISLPISGPRFLWSVVKSLSYQSNLLVSDTGNRLLFLLTYAFQLVLLIFFFLKSKPRLTYVKSRNGNLWILFFSVGIFYWICTTFIIKGRGEAFIPRFWAPAMFLFLFTVITLLNKKCSLSLWGYSKKFLLTMAILSFVLNVPLKIVKNHFLDGKKSYSVNVADIKAKYQLIPKGSMMVLGDIHLNYLRTDIRIMYPAMLPKKETLDELLERITNLPYENIYFVVPKDKLDERRFDNSIIDFANKNKGLEFVKIK